MTSPSPHPTRDRGGCELTSYGEMADVIEGLAGIVREARRSRRVSQRAASRQARLITEMTVHRLERGEGISIEAVIALLRWLDQPSPDADVEEADRG